jgi:hypothetical protein
VNKCKHPDIQIIQRRVWLVKHTIINGEVVRHTEPKQYLSKLEVKCLVCDYSRNVHHPDYLPKWIQKKLGGQMLEKD